MLEILFLFWIGKYLAALVRQKGREPAVWIVALIFGWYAGEIVAGSAALGIIYWITNEKPNILLLVPFALLGGGAVGWLICRLAQNLTPLETTPGTAQPPPLPPAVALPESAIDLPLRDYYLIMGGQRTGPFSLYQIRAQYHGGQITDETLYWLPGEEGWQPLGKIAPHLGQD
ncbi:MAG: DUF4339 domain-containing protein [Chthoniobacteraceae bacterium]